jgi:hypothetical protein
LRALGALAAALTLALVLVLALGLRRRQPARPAALLVTLARRAGARVEPSSTLRELADMLAGRVGPRTAALATAAERVRYAPPAPAVPARRAAVVRALVADVGLVRAVALLVAPRPRARSRRRA